METPICDFVNKYADSKALRLHMPGHKGTPIIGVEQLDITEIDGADVLYSTSNGIISQSQKNAACLFGTQKTLYSAEGSSLSIRAMLCLAVMQAKACGRRPLIAAARNAHKVFMSACALLDIDIEWLYPSANSDDIGNGIISCKIDAEGLDKRLSDMYEKPSAVYITSPDYLGNIADIEGIARVCHKRGISLLVDNAHGAYLNFLPVSCHPIALGADMCCDSAHKTLPVLTGGAYLHISKNASRAFSENAEAAMSLFASTSPSYLILQSLDAANKYLSDGYREKAAALVASVTALKEHLKWLGFTLTGDEPFKLTVSLKMYGYTGYELAAILQTNGIVCEFADPDYTVLMFTPEISASDIIRLQNILSSIPKKEPIYTAPPRIPRLEKILSVREAMLSASEELNVSQCLGRTLAQATVSCPPAIPIVVCGEKIDTDAIKCLEYYGIERCRVTNIKKQ